MPGIEEILSCVVLTVTAGIVLHGVSAHLASERFARGEPADNGRASN